MRSPFRQFCAFIVFGAISLVFSFTGLGQNFNVDFGDHSFGEEATPVGPPASAFGAAANQPGFWNLIAVAGPTTLNNLAGNPSAAQITLTAEIFNGSGGAHTGDLEKLLDDNFYSNNGTPWSFTITGLTNGTYSFYYYGPANSLVDTGPFTVNGVAASNVVGDGGSNVDSTPLTQGLNWNVLSNIVVSGGTLTVTSTNTSTFHGLAGFQLAIVPEPGVVSLLVVGGGVAAFVLRKRRTS